MQEHAYTTGLKVHSPDAWPCCHINFPRTCFDHRLEEAETNLVAKQEANALLNSQVDLLTKQLQELQAGKAAYEKHFKDLSVLLAEERREKAGQSKKVWALVLFLPATLMCWRCNVKADALLTFPGAAEW